MIRRGMARKSQSKRSFGPSKELRWAFAVICVIVCMVLSTEPAHALELNYGGRLAEPSGEPVAGPLDMTFKFYRDASGGDPLVTVGVPNVPLVDGMFQVTLNIDPVDLDRMFEDGDKTVYVEVVSQGKIYPRQKFGYVPLALRVPVDGTKIVYDNQGRLTLGDGAGSASGDLPGATGAGGVERVGV